MNESDVPVIRLFDQKKDIKKKQNVIILFQKYHTPRAPTTKQQAFKNNYQSAVSSKSGHGLKLKDYIRLATITKRSNSNSSKKQESQTESPSSASKNQPSLNTQKSLNILKDQLKSDFSICLEKTKDLMHKIDINSNKFADQSTQYDQIVLLCQLNRIVKEQIIANLDKASNLIAQHKHKQFLKFSSQSKQLAGDEIKKSTNAKRRSSLYASSIRSQYLDHSQS